MVDVHAIVFGGHRGHVPWPHIECDAATSAPTVVTTKPAHNRTTTNDNLTVP